MPGLTTAAMQRALGVVLIIQGLAIAVGLAVAVVAVAWNGLLIVASAELLGWLAGLIGL